MKPIAYISGYCNGLLPPTPPPLGAGAALPERKPPPTRKEESKLPRLKWAQEKHGLDPALLAKDAEPEDKSEPEPILTPAEYLAALERARANKGVL